MNTSAAAATWQSQTYTKISHRMGIRSQEHEETKLLKTAADRLRAIRRLLLNERFD